MRTFTNRLLATLGLGLLAATAAHAQLGVSTGANAPTSTLQVVGSLAGNYKTVTTASYAMLATDYYVAYNASNTAAGAFTLPAAASGTASIIGRTYYIKNDNTTYNVVVTPAGSETINGAASVTVPAGQSVQLISTGTTGATPTWEVVQFAASTTGGATAASTASNGLTKTGSNITLGGTLTQVTTITNNGFGLNVAGSASTTTLAATGKVGFGLVPTATTGLLHLYGNTTAGSTFDPATATGAPAGTLSGTADLLFGRGSITKGSSIQGLDDGQFGGGLYFNVHKTGIGSDTWPSDVLTAMTVRPNGFVGIGTTVPGAKLEVAGTSSTFGAGIILNNTTGTTGRKFSVASRTDLTNGTGANGEFIIADETAAAARMAIDQNGSVGIGTVAPVSHLSVVSDNAGNATADDVEIASFNSTPGNALFFKSATGTQAAPGNLANGLSLGQIVFQGRANGAFVSLSNILANYVGNGTTALSNLQFQTSTLERMRIDQNGNVGIGTVNPTSPLYVIGNATPNTGGIVVSTGAVTLGSIGQGTANVNATEMTSEYFTSQRNTTNYFAAHPTGTASGAGFMAFFYAGSTIGSVTQNGTTAVLYNTTSDIRLKENIRPTAYGLADVLKVQVSDYNYKADKTLPQTGFIAQQLYTVYPLAVTKGGDDAKTTPWQVDYSKLTPLLTKAIQEQQAEIEALKAQNSALKASLDSKASASTLNEMQAALQSLRTEVQSLKAAGITISTT